MIRKDTKVHTTIDWISVTAAKIIHPSWMTKEHTNLKRGMLNYDAGIRYEDGRVELWHSSRDEMGSHLIMSGETLTWICSTCRKSVWDILKAYNYARPSRIDVAVDVINGTLDIGRMSDDIAKNKVRTRAVSGLYLENVGEVDGETLYVGSPGGNRRLRVYDKASETGMDGEWTRIELQTRQRYARKTSIALMSRFNDPNAIPEIILSFADWKDYTVWKWAMGREAMEMPKLKKPESNRRTWILDTCARAIAKEIESSTDTDLIAKLLDAVEVNRDAIRSKIKTK